MLIIGVILIEMSKLSMVVGVETMLKVDYLMLLKEMKVIIGI